MNDTESGVEFTPSKTQAYERGFTSAIRAAGSVVVSSLINSCLVPGNRIQKFMNDHSRQPDQVVPGSPPQEQPSALQQVQKIAAFLPRIYK